MGPVHRQCCAVGCGNKGVFAFPKNYVVRRQWITVMYSMQLKNLKITDDSMLCSNHFLPSEIYTENYDTLNGLKVTRNVLKAGAVPSLFENKGDIRAEKNTQREITNEVDPLVVIKTEIPDKLTAKLNLFDKPLSKIHAEPETTSSQGTPPKTLPNENIYETNSQTMDTESMEEETTMGTELVPELEMKVERIGCDADETDCENFEEIEYLESDLEMDGEDNKLPAIEILDKAKVEIQQPQTQPQPTLQHSIPMLVVDGKSGHVSIKLGSSSRLQEEQSKKVYDTPKMSVETPKLQEKTIEKFNPITKAAIETTKQNIPIQRVNPVKRNPMIIKKVNSETLKEVMKTGNLKPIHKDSPLHKQLTSAMSQIPKQDNVKEPMEITLAATSSPVKTTQSPVNTNTPLPSQQPIPNKPRDTIMIKKMNKEALQNVLKSGNLKPIDINSPLYKKLSTMLKLPHKEDKQSKVTVSNTRSAKNSTQTGEMTCGNVCRQDQTSQQILKPKTYNNSTPYTEEEREIRRELAKAKGQLRKCQLREQRQKQRLEKLKVLKDHPVFLGCLETMPPAVKTLTLLQLRESVKLSSHGRRFTDEEKSLAHTLLQQSAHVYKFMQQLGFILPVPKHLNKSFARNETETAIDPDNALGKLKEKVSKMKATHRFCTLLFDEKLLRPVNRKKKIDTALGDGSGEDFLADHALIFMVKGILKFYQEPVSYTFSYGETSGTQLAELIKKVISDLQSVGFKVLATICDHADNNRRAIETLINEARCDFLLSGSQYNDNIFVVNNEQIVALYDPPHLLKGIRNHLISKNLTFVMNGKKKTAEWRHLEMMLRENPEYKGERLISKLTENHVYLKANGLTKIKYASQIFSQTVSSYMGYLAEKDILPPESQDTADLLLFFDQLFDSFNGYLANTHKNGKPLLQTCKLKSAHHKKWAESIEVLKTMSFIENGVPVEVVDIECWIWTLQSIQLLMKKLLVDHKVPNVWMRHLNQDAVERLFRTEINPTHKSVNEKDLPVNGSLAGDMITTKVINAVTRVTKHLDNL